MYKFNNLNQALIGMSKELLKNGVSRKTRGFDCIEIPNPVLICIENPSDRYINIPERKWNKVFGFVESLWIASGTNNMKLVGDYVPNMYTYSDDGYYMRAAYGPRIRAMQGFATDYKIDDPESRNIFSGFVKTVDQLKFVVDSLKRDINTRQALITIHDPVKDDYDEQNSLKITKDTPCCRTLQFMVVDGKLDCTLTIRSNDLIFGFSAVNVFNFTLMQEYIAAIIGIPVGKYYHFVNNLHFYSDKLELVKYLSKLNLDDYKSEFGCWEYRDNCADFTFEDFDEDVNKLFYFEKFLREEKVMIDFPIFKYSLFNDWARIFFNKWNNGEQRFTFDNPYLNKLFGVKNKNLYDYSQINKVND